MNSRTNDTIMRLNRAYSSLMQMEDYLLKDNSSLKGEGHFQIAREEILICKQMLMTTSTETTPIESKENVNHPSHYNTGKIEVIDIIEDQGMDFHIGNAFKYLSRAGKKDSSKYLEDLKKAKWYLERRDTSVMFNNESIRPETIIYDQKPVGMLALIIAELLYMNMSVQYQPTDNRLSDIIRSLDNLIQAEENASENQSQRCD